jgi:hypothetical protein
MEAHFRHLRFNRFPMWFFPLQSPSQNLGVHQDSNSQNGSSFGSVKVHSLTLFCALGSMRCDSRASFLARNLASPYLGCEPKARLATKNLSLYCNNFASGFMDDSGCDNQHDCIHVYLFSWYGLPCYLTTRKYNITFQISFHNSFCYYGFISALYHLCEKKSLSKLYMNVFI